ncbi:glycerol-3-phosphate 1-O-acyltransferase PlsY [Alkalithermobacter paradoxus]|uniref:Glycerol-3-phosphate acyltransferase n=1 Tax=Alkalithermobacter paradoxus TaxID=29349 RepID=A0A1V4IAA7_9FIRM|nr:glycerol-3-phosphate acyltransferase [[Clostridium] thermoalcaliphilum]
MSAEVLSALIAYFIGNFSTSYIIGKLNGNIDIRKYGSGNAGATNVLRTLGKKAALYTFLGDAFKGVLAVIIGSRLGGEKAALVAAICVVLGHNWPVFLKFKGGKGVATTIGSILAIDPIVGVFSLAVGIISIIKTKYVSLGSVLGIVSLPIFMLYRGGNRLLVSCILALIIVFTHRENIKRLMNGTERKIGQKTEIR